MSIKKLSVAALGISLASGASLAENVTSNGGLMVGSTDMPYWFKIGGVVKLDQRLFMGSKTAKGNEFRSGANIRDLGLDVEGGIAKDITYTLGFSFNSKDSKVDVEDAYLTYHGFAPRLTASIGQVNPGFCLENTSSSKWTPFMERSMASTAFGACPGLGVSVNKWDDNYSLAFSVTQPKQSGDPVDANGATVSRSDRWRTSARATYAPVLDGNKIVQLGVSGHIEDDGQAAARFKSHPEAKARNITEVLDTGRLRAKNHSALDFELSAQNGPMYAEAEYQVAYVKRAKTDGSKAHTNRFHGYHVQAAYVLTGESRAFKANSGTFGKITPKGDCGAWEVAGRYSFLSLNDNDIKGGRAHNATVGLNYYMNEHIRVAGEYTHSRLHPSANAVATLANQQNRSLGILGLRLQAVF